jgi:Endoribonuclease L-PSP
MTRQLISTGSPFEKAYGYSRAVAHGPFVFVSGTTGYDYATMTMPENVSEQARNCWRTIDTVLATAGASLEDIVRATYYVTSPACPAGLRRGARRDPSRGGYSHRVRPSQARDEGRDRSDRDEAGSLTRHFQSEKTSTSFSCRVRLCAGIPTAKGARFRSGWPGQPSDQVPRAGPAMTKKKQGCHGYL